MDDGDGGGDLIVSTAGTIDMTGTLRINDGTLDMNGHDLFCRWQCGILTTHLMRAHQEELIQRLLLAAIGMPPVERLHRRTQPLCFTGTTSALTITSGGESFNNLIINGTPGLVAYYKFDEATGNTAI